MNINLENIKEVLGDSLLSIEGDIPDLLPVSVTNDSRNVDAYTIFVAIKGSSVDGHDFIESAVNSDCQVIACSTLPEVNLKGVLFLKVSNPYSAYALLAELYAGFPSESLELVGVTGTNGKTTTAYLTRSILKQVAPCGFISTVEYETGEKVTSATRTTPDSLELQEMYTEMKDSGCEYCVMEVSSHALDQNRIGSAKFAVAVFTNLTGDHLDYHKDMESYFQAKKVLFEEHLADVGAALINIDDLFGRRLYELLKNDKHVFSYGIDENADFCIENLSSQLEKTEFKLNSPGDVIPLSSPLSGRFNAYNIAAAAGTAVLLGIDKTAIIEGVAEMNSVPGRMERCYDKPIVFVDYAHTDDALENVLSTVSDLLDDRKLTVVFGCGGDRDRTKRSRMGAVAAKFADKIFVTSDNPRSEDPDSIISEITAGIPENISYDVIPDRKDAIHAAIETASENDVIIIAGKGHEDYQEIKGVKYPFDDREVVREILGR